MALLATEAQSESGGIQSSRFAHIRALDGIRGIAVLIVVVYHFAPNVLPAGFIGVDVFFVLSGFLITSLALREHQSTKSISATNFYTRRARRLLPAAIVTVVVAVALAAVIQPDSTRAATRGQGIASLLYVANWWMIDQRNSYQAAFGTESPLSHFWSLAVEEQFYVIFPFLLLGLILLVGRRRGATRKFCTWLFGISILGAIASATLMAAEFDAEADPSRIYLGTDTRIHAIFVGVAGGCVWWLWSEELRERASLAVLSVLAVISAVFLGLVSVTSDFRSPWLYRYGFLAISIAALALVLAAAARSSIITTVFQLRWLCVLGLVSYSVYLWHWPVRVFCTSSNTPFAGLSLFIVRVALTAIAATLSYLLIERPFRAISEPRRVATFSILALSIALVAVWVISRPVPAPATEFSTTEAPTAEVANGEPVRLLLFGDSVAWNLGGGHLDFPHPVGYDSPFDNSRVLLWNKADYGCPLLRYPLRSFAVVKQNTDWCVRRESEWPPLLAQFSPDVVAWSSTLLDTYDSKIDGRWVSFGSPEWVNVYNENLESTRQIVITSGAKFMLLSQADPVPDPTQSGDGQESLLPANIWRFEFVRDLQRRFAEAHPQDTVFVDLQPIICPEGTCRGAAIDPNGDRPDGIHLTPGAVNAIGPQVQSAIERALGR